MKFKTTKVSSSEHSLTVLIEILNNGKTEEVVGIRLPFKVVPPQIAHQIASQLALCNSYLVEDGKDGNPVSVPPIK